MPRIAKPEGSAPAVKILHHTAICLARKRIWIQNPYFIPEPEAIDAFGEAVKRGVDVRVMMPSTGGSDNPMVQHAGHRNFEKLLRCGVRLFEYPAHAAAPESHDHRRRVELPSVRATSTTALSRPTTRSRSASGTQQRRAARCSLREVRPPLQGNRARGVAQARAVHKLKDNVFYMLNELL